MQFWQTAASQYADSSQRLAGALQALTPQGWGDDGTAPKAETRDHMTVSGEPASREAGDPHPHKDRRAA
jgi:hypothetical protein